MIRGTFAVLVGFLAVAVFCEGVALLWRFVRAIVRDLNPWRAPKNRGERRAAARRKARR